LGQIFTVAFAPLGLLWRFAETWIWSSIAALTLAAVAAWAIGQPVATAIIASLVAVLLMRIDPLETARRAAAKPGV
jgi:chromate transport protein ChrA